MGHASEKEVAVAVMTERGDLPGTLPNIPAELPGVVCEQSVRRGNKRHVYHARFWREDGRLRKQYVRKDDVEAVRAACAARQAAERERRERRGVIPFGIGKYEWDEQRRQINRTIRDTVGENMSPNRLRKLLYRR